MLTAEEKVLFNHLRDDIEQISAAASHDLRDQLREALGYCTRLRGLCDASGLPLLADVERCIEGTMQNVAALRNYAYLAQNLERVQPVSLEGVLEKARLDNAALIAQSGGRVTWSGMLPTLEARPIQLAQMFAHLMENGLKYNRSDMPEVRITVSDTGHFYECMVEDNGVGMPSEFAYLVFGLFKRAEPEGAVKGCGAGLSVAKKVAENHGGAIAMDCEEGYGCRITVTLPHIAKAVQSTCAIENSAAHS